MEIYGSLAVIENDDVLPLLSSLSPEERVMVYHLKNACKPWNNMARFQSGRHNKEFFDALVTLLRSPKPQPTEGTKTTYTPLPNGGTVIGTSWAGCSRVEIVPYDARALFKDYFVESLKEYIVLFWSEHGPFSWAHRSKLAKPKFTLEELLCRLRTTGIVYSYKAPEEWKIFWSDDLEQVVDGNIEKSGGNYYGEGVTTEMYNASTLKEKTGLEVYFEKADDDSDNEDPLVATSYCSLHRKDLAESLQHLNLALTQALNYPERFDEHFAKSLVYLTKYLETGNEKLFQLHCEEWIHTNSRVDYTMGWIEQYNDPMSVRGHAAAEVTVKTVDMSTFAQLMPELEASLPYPPEYRRDTGATLTNPSTNRQVYGAGQYGPGVMLAAYCLPNYDDIRDEQGSKQIMYAESKKKLSEKLNPELAKKLRTTFKKSLDQYDPDKELDADLWNIQVVLHETVGHGSGSLDKTYDGTKVTPENLKELIPEDLNSLEELRAEINAVYMALTEYDLLKDTDLFKNGHWHKVLAEDLFKECIFRASFMGGVGRLARHPEGFDKVVGAHARADMVITSWLLKHGCAEIVEEEVNGFTLLSCNMLRPMNECLEVIADLAELVMRLKAKGNGKAVADLFSKYTIGVISLEDAHRYRDAQDKVRKALVGDIKGGVYKYYKQVPIH